MASIRIPKLSWPMIGSITQKWGENPDDYLQYGYPGHNGLDIGGRGPVSPCDFGVVLKKIFGIADYGNHIIVQHEWGASYYAHLRDGTITIKSGEKVFPNTPFAISNSTGNSTGDHLHFGVRLKDRSGEWKGFVDPLPYLGGEIVPPEIEPGKFVTALGGFRLRTSPMLGDGNIFALTAGYIQVEVVAVEGDWFRIKAPEALYIHKTGIE